MAKNRELSRRTKQLEQENEILRRATAHFARPPHSIHHDDPDSTVITSSTLSTISATGRGKLLTRFTGAGIEHVDQQQSRKPQ